MLLNRYSVQRPIATCMLFIFCIGLGLFYLSQISMNDMPKISKNTVHIYIHHDKGTIQKIRNDIIIPFENHLNSIIGLENIQAKILDKSATLTLKFDKQYSIDKKTTEINEILSQFSFTKDIRYSVLKENASTSPMLYFGLSSTKHDLTAISYFYKNTLEPKLYLISGVNSLLHFGDLEERIEIQFNPLFIKQLQISPETIKTALKQYQIDNNLGEIETQDHIFEIQIKQNHLHTIDDIKNIKLFNLQNQLFLLKDIATIEKKEKNVYQNGFFINDNKVIGIGVMNDPLTNPTILSKNLHFFMEQFNQEFQGEFSLEVILDQTEYLQETIEQFFYTICFSLLLIAGILYLFLHQINVVFIAIITIIGTLCSSITLLYYLNISINIFTLLAFILSIGLLIDDMIVVIENMIKVQEQKKLNHLLSAYLGSKSVYFAVITTTLVLAAVCIPILFSTSNIGQYFYEFTMTLIINIVISTLFSLCIIPALYSLCSDKGHHNKKNNSIALMSLLENIYTNILKHIIPQKKYYIPFIFFTILTLSMLSHIDNQIMPTEDVNLIFISTEKDNNTHYNSTEKDLNIIYTALKELKKTETDIQQIFYQIHNNSSFTLISLTKDKERKKDINTLINIINDTVQPLSESEIFVFQPGGLLSNHSQKQKSFHFILSGLPHQQLQKNSEQFITELQQLPYIETVNTIKEEVKRRIALELEIDKIISLGILPEDVITTIENTIKNSHIADINIDQKEIPIYLLANTTEMWENIDIFNSLTIKNNQHITIPIYDLIQVKEINNINDLRRYQRKDAIYIEFTLKEAYHAIDLFTVRHDLESIKNNISPFMTIDYKKELQEISENNYEMLWMSLLSFILSFMILTMLFESLINPFIIILSLPFGILGGLFTMYLADINFNIFSQMGLFLLIGISTKNGILIVEFIHHYRNANEPFYTSILKGAKQRLRPILMTSLTTILGTLPLLFSSGSGDIQRYILGIVIFGGICCSLIASIFIIPMLYYLLGQHSKAPEYKKQLLTKYLEDLNAKSQ